MHLIARAKLTLSLRVLGVRSDGFHELEALVASVVSPHDGVILYLREKPFCMRGEAVHVWGGAGAGVPTDETNLAVRAARTLTDRPLGMSLHKCIPPGAGLGGGSADAAALLLGVDRLLGLGRSAEALRALAAGLGSDVPFCLDGGLAWMRGRGEVIEPLAPRDGPAMVIAVPPFGISTPAVYRAWDDLGGPASVRVCPVPLELADLLPSGLVNDLEPAAEAVESRLRPFREALEALAGAPAVMTGSGSAYFVPVGSMDEASTLASAARRAGINAFSSKPVPQGVEVIPDPS